MQRRPLSLRIFVFWNMVLVAMVTVVVLGFFVHFAVIRTIESTISKEQHRLTEEIARAVDQYYSTAESVVGTLAEELALGSRQEVSIKAIISHFPQFTSLEVVDASGKVLAKAETSPHALGFRFGRDQDVQPPRVNAPIVSGPHKGGLVRGELNPAVLGRILIGPDPTRATSSTLLDPAGRVLARIGSSSSRPVVAQGLAQVIARRPALPPTGVYEGNLASVVRVSQPGWVLTYEEPARRALAAVRLARIAFWVLTPLALLMAVVLSYQLAEAIASPVRRLAATSASLAHHDALTPEPAINGPFRELDTLLSSFDKLASGLARGETELSETLSKLKAERDYLQRLIESAFDAVAEFSAQGQLVFCNEGFAKLVKRSPGELSGATWADLVVSDDLPKVQEQLEQRESGVPTIPVGLRTGPGEIRHVLLRILRKDDPSDDAERHLAFAYDVTREVEEKEEANRLAQLNAQLRAVAEEQAGRLEKLARVVVEAQENERHRIAQDIHDWTAQRITSSFYRVQLIERLLSKKPEAVPRELEELATILESANTELREIMRNLHPHLLSELGLAAAVRELVGDFAHQNGLDHRVTVEEGPTPPPEHVSIAVFRILQEALNNVEKHAAAHHVDVELTIGAAEAALVVADDGEGFELTRTATGRMGISGMRERAELLGGALTIATAPGKGTKIEVTVPWS